MQPILNEKMPTFYEVLAAANKATDPVEVLKAAMAKDKRVIDVLAYSVNPTQRIPLPRGMPPYIPSTAPLGMSEVEILHLWNKIYVMFQQEAKQYKREERFIQWIEKMAPQEAEVMIAIKDQNLYTLFPAITEDILVECFGWNVEKFKELKSRTNP